MRLAYKALSITLISLALLITVSAQTQRTAKDDRNIAPTVGTGSGPGGPTGLFTVYDGQTLRKGEFTFSIAYSSFARDPGNVNFVEVPVSFQAGVNDYLEVFFNTDAYRAIKVNSYRNLSGFYLPNSLVNANGIYGTLPAIVAGTGTPGSLTIGTAVFRPQGRQPFVNYPFIGGSAGPFGIIGNSTGGGNGAAVFPGLGSPYGSILPGVVLQTTNITNAAGTTVIGTAPTSFTVAPSYLPDAPFINRQYAESSFSTFSVGAKLRFTGPNNPVGFGVIPFYRFYADKADNATGFNQLTRGSSPGSNIGDFGVIGFADARARKWLNISGNIGYVHNGDVKINDVVILDRPDELLAGVGLDFPVNKFFQPILELRSTQYVGGRTPNAFENSPVEGLAGFRVFVTRYAGLSFAYRYQFNQQDADSFKNNNFAGTVSVVGATAPINNNFTGAPRGFLASQDPNGFMVQGFIGRRNKRLDVIINPPANVTDLTLSKTAINLGCPAGQRSESGTCSDDMSVNVSTTAVDPDNDVLTYSYTVSGGRIVGQGANVNWDLTGATPGSYTITAGVDDGCGICGQTQTRTINVQNCPDCKIVCTCPTVSVTGPSGTVAPGEQMTFTANLNGTGQENATYNWTVDKGTIIEGQGTPSITVSTEGLTDTTVLAEVEIGGLCADCPRTTASETGVIGANPRPILIEEFGNKPNDEIRNSIDQFIIDLQNNPNATGYIINYGSARDVAAREKIIRNQIDFRNFDRSRITIINGGVEPEVRTQLYRVPQGAEPPTP